MSPSVRKKLAIYAIFVTVSCAAGFAVSLLFDPVLDSPVGHETPSE